MKKLTCLALIALLSTSYTIVAASTPTDVSATPAGPVRVAAADAYRTAMSDRMGPSDTVQSTLDMVAANPRTNLTRRSSVMALNGLDPQQRIGNIRKAGDATVILQGMYHDATADFSRLTGLYFSNGIKKDLPRIPKFELSPAGIYTEVMPVVPVMAPHNPSLAMFNMVAQRVAELGGSITDMGGSYIINAPAADARGPARELSGPIFEQLVQHLVQLNGDLRMDLANNGIDPR